MSGDSLPLSLPLARFAADSCEATTLYRELRKPLLRYLVCLGLSADEAQDVVQDAFVRGYVFRLAPCLQLLQRPDNLRFCVPALRLLPLSFVRNHTRTCSESGEQVRCEKLFAPAQEKRFEQRVLPILVFA